MPSVSEDIPGNPTNSHSTHYGSRCYQNSFIFFVFSLLLLMYVGINHLILNFLKDEVFFLIVFIEIVHPLR